MSDYSIEMARAKMSDMEPLQLLVVLILVVVLGVQIYATFFRTRDVRKEEREKILFQEIKDLRTTLDQRLERNNESIQERMRVQSNDSLQLIENITKEITSVKEIGRQTQSFAQQIQSLQDILQNSKQRGGLGEYQLDLVLQNVLPPGIYEMQYPFANGEIVDAVVHVKKKLVPIDSKFPLENYKRFVNATGAEQVSFEKAFINDLKMRITETAKYIRPQEGTMDFAFMFIPSEAIYYDLLTNKIGAGEEQNLIQRAAGKYKVIIVSPTSFLAYLQTVLQGLKALEIEEKAIDIIKNVEKLGMHIGKYDESFKKLGNSLSTTVNHYTAAQKELTKIDKDVTRITGAEIGIEPLAIDKPQQADE